MLHRSSHRTILSLIISAIALSACAQIHDWHPWKGRNVAYFGDSITDPRNKAASKKYWSWLQEWLGTTPWVYAVSGRTWDDIPRQTDKLVKQHGNDVDAIVILVGTNDFANAIPLGDWYNEADGTVTAGLGRTKRDITLRRRTLFDRLHHLPGAHQHSPVKTQEHLPRQADRTHHTPAPWRILQIRHQLAA